MPADDRSTSNPADITSRRNRNSLISRDLDDIYLLLDHLSGRADKNVSALTIEMEAVTQDAQGTLFVIPGPTVKTNLIKSVCEIEGWPPSSQIRYSAIAATTLFKARDVLNEIAWPASGMTVAYTIMVTDLSNRSIVKTDPSHPSSRSSAPSDKAFRKALLHLIARLCRVEPAPSSDPQTTSDDMRDSGQDAARTSLAISAYPHLLRPARKLRTWIFAYICMLIAMLAITAVLSWNVAAGKLIIERLNDLKLRETTEAARLVTADGQPGTALLATGAGGDDVPDAGYVFDTLCTPDGLALPRPAASAPGQAAAPIDPATLRRNSLCGKGLAILDQRFAADDSLRQWFDPWKHVTSFGAGLGPAMVGPANNQARIKAAAPIEQQAGDANSVLATYVLPILYGLLGAATAVIRNLNGKMRESTLAPRDLRVSQVQLALGVLVGACIGLFLSPTGAPDVRLPNVTLAGNGVALSASALSFIAGFGVEAVFKWLEVIISIAFAAGGTASQHASPPPARQMPRPP